MELIKYMGFGRALAGCSCLLCHKKIKDGNQVHNFMNTRYKEIENYCSPCFKLIKKEMEWNIEWN